VVHMRVPVVRMPVAPPQALVAPTRRAAQTVRSSLPPTDRLVYYGGLAALAAVGVVEWPVAAAVGAGVWIATRARERGAGPAVGTQEATGAASESRDIPAKAAG
jgi:hypothetical protein